MAYTQALQVKAFTRWHQLSVPLGFLLSAAAFMALVFGLRQPLWAIAAALAGLIVPPLVAFRGFPTRDTLTVQADGLSFMRRGLIPFSQITHWSADDYLKLGRRGKPTILVSTLDAPGRQHLLKAFPAALAAWQSRQRPGQPLAQQTHFYGTWRAQSVGILIMALGLLSAWMALRLREANVSLTLVGGLGVLFGAGMLFMKRR